MKKIQLVDNLYNSVQKKYLQAKLIINKQIKQIRATEMLKQKCVGNIKKAKLMKNDIKVKLNESLVRQYTSRQKGAQKIIESTMRKEKRSIKLARNAKIHSILKTNMTKSKKYLKKEKRSAIQAMHVEFRVKKQDELANLMLGKMNKKINKIKVPEKKIVQQIPKKKIVLKVYKKFDEEKAVDKIMNDISDKIIRYFQEKKVGKTLVQNKNKCEVISLAKPTQELKEPKSFLIKKN